MLKFLEIFFYSLAMAFVCAPLATPICCYLRKVFYVPLAKRKILEKAIADGHEVQGYLIDSYEALGGTDNHTVSTNKCHAVYQYQYEGKTYKYKALCHGSPEKEITLFFETKPNRACLAHELGYRESRNWKKYFACMLIAFSFVFLFIEAYKYMA